MSTPSSAQLGEAQMELWRFSSYGDTLQGIESSIVSFQSQIANFPQDGAVTVELADLYTQYYENAEAIIVLMLNCHEIHIDPTYRVTTRKQGHSYREVQIDPVFQGQVQAPGKHAFHEAVLQSLAAPKNPLHEMLGHGSVHGFLRDAKEFRNKWTQRRRENDTSNRLLYSMPAMNFLRLQMREFHAALETALDETKREVERRGLERRGLERRGLERPLEASKMREGWRAFRERKLQGSESRSQEEAANPAQIEIQNVDQATLIAELEQKVKILEDVNSAQATELLRYKIREKRIDSLLDKNRELVLKVQALEHEGMVQIPEIGFMAWYDQLYRRWSKAIIDNMEKRNLPGARATLDEAHELSKQSVGHLDTHVGLALKILETVLALGEAKRKTAMEKLQLVMEELKQ